jgi:hypothetical protein
VQDARHSFFSFLSPFGLWAIADALDDLRCDSGWFDGLDLSRDREDSRTPFSGDKFSAVREVAETEGFSFREVCSGGCGNRN